MSELFFYKYWVEKVEKQKKWISSANWSNFEYQTLSDEISKYSGTQISRNTIRNIIDKINSNDENYQPQSATKDALAKYIGYANWETYINQRSFKVNKKYIGIGIIAACLFIAIGWYLLYSNKSVGEFRFEIINPIGAAPYTIACQYDVSKVKSNNIKIDFGFIGVHGGYMLKDLEKDKHLIKQCFQFPGVYKVRLFIDEKPYKEQLIRINSDNWFIYAGNALEGKNEIPEMISKLGTNQIRLIKFDYILPRMITPEGALHIPKQQIEKIEGIRSGYNTYFRNIKAFGIPVRDCRFSVRFKNEDFGKGVQCYDAAFRLIGTKGDISFRFTEKGCENYVHYHIGDVYKSGVSSDQLNFLVLEFANYRTIKIESKANYVSLYTEDKKLITLPDHQDLGELIGIQMIFKGSPHIDDVQLTDNKNKMIYFDQFSDMTK